MDTNAPKTPATLPFAAWQSLTPTDAARAIHARVTALPAPLRQAAIAWLRPEVELAALLGGPVSRWTADDQEIPPPPDQFPSLHGVPYLLKDLFDLAHVPTRAGSVFLDKVRPTPTRDSQLVKTLREAGAVCAGKTHLVEFASGLTGENPHYGDCPHPFFPDRLSGGSSSGSAALVAAGVTPLSFGTDTGGSVRVPAAWCGLYGFRLSPGDEFIRDAFPLAPSLDTTGWFTANAKDMLTAWQALVGRANRPDEPVSTKGTTARPEDSPYRGCYLDARKLVPGIAPEVWTACEKAAARLAQPAEAECEISLLTSWQDAVDAYLAIGMSEAYTVHRDWLAPYREHYDPVIWQRFTDAGHFPAEKIDQARATMAAIRSVWRKFFEAYDFLVLPSVPCAAPRKAEATPDLRRDILRLTAPASLGGLPVFSIPVQLPSGLTAGLQVILPSATSPVVPWLVQLH